MSMSRRATEAEWREVVAEIAKRNLTRAHALMADITETITWNIAGNPILLAHPGSTKANLDARRAGNVTAGALQGGPVVAKTPLRVVQGSAAPSAGKRTCNRLGIEVSASNRHCLAAGTSVGSCGTCGGHVHDAA
jgi:hypothetical protein